MSWRWRLSLCSPQLRAALRSELLAELARPAELDEPLPEAVAAAAEEHPSATVRAALAEIAPRLAEGEALSESLRGLEAFVGPETRAVLRAAERSAAVTPALVELEAASCAAEEAAAALRRTWIAPGLTLIVALLAYAVLASATLPVLLSLVGESKPWLLNLLPDWGLGPRAWLVSCAVLVVLGLLAVRQLGRMRGGDRLVEALPYWGALRRSARGVHAARTLSRLLRAGVSLDEALRATAEVFPPGDARREMLGAAGLLEDGASAREVFSAPRGSLPPILRAVLAAADGDDGLADGLERLARFGEADLERLAGRAELGSALAAVAIAGLLAGFVAVLGWSAYFEALGASSF